MKGEGEKGRRRAGGKQRIEYLLKSKTETNPSPYATEVINEFESCGRIARTREPKSKTAVLEKIRESQKRTVPSREPVNICEFCSSASVCGR